MGVIVKIARNSSPQETKRALEKLYKKSGKFKQKSLKDYFGKLPGSFGDGIDYQKKLGMNGNKFLADTNTFIYLLNKHSALQPLLESEWLFSFITEIELLGKPDITEKEKREVKGMLGVCFKVVHVEAINQITIQLKQQYKIKLPDGLIAATALYQRVPLLTYDKGFTRIKEIDVVLLEP